MKDIDLPKPGDHLVLQLNALTDDYEQGCSYRFSWRRAAHECSPIWVVRLPALRNPEASPQKAGEGVFALSFQLAEARALVLHTFENREPLAALREMFRESPALPSAVLIWVRFGVLSVITRQNDASHKPQP